ncbi:T9SS type A sorting domain-containing protein [Spirosoma sp. 48-14]|uniref:T9SS type A sorting domain-containing protein n=1 Tax=Spirosoma sp. 48-14 TaxID=1895854 RepID=UPI0025CF2ECC|nr:T9SS type A sorting domain-containing protein [Spirosoma sp. 48-14]
MAQSIQNRLTIKISYEKAGQYRERAIETIEASNLLIKNTDVEYKAGRSISLLPGFQAQHGSQFVAQIDPVMQQGEPTLQLTAFPNPFEQSTTINYYLPADGKVNLWIIDSQGKVVAQLLRDEDQPSGSHRLEWKPEAISSGMYIPIVEVNQQRVSGRLVKK